jgi:hypothetical protein
MTDLSALRHRLAMQRRYVVVGRQDRDAPAARRRKAHFNMALQCPFLDFVVQQDYFIKLFDTEL